MIQHDDALTMTKGPAHQESPVLPHEGSIAASHDTESLLLNSPEMDGASFEALMKERTRIRKEREEYSVAELKVRISKLEQALVGEVKRRVDATQALEETARKHVSQMEKRLEQQFDLRSIQIQERLDRLETKLNNLEARMTLDSQQQLDGVKQKGHEFGKQVDSLKREIEGEKKARLVREGRFLQQLESHSQELDQIWSRAKQERVSSLSLLEQTLELENKARYQQQTEWQSRIDTELQELTRELQEEVQERETQDDAIVEALNQFTHQLQSSLAILNGE